MDSSLLPSSATEEAIEAGFARYQTALQGMDRSTLLRHLTEINGQLEAQRSSILSNVLAPTAGLSDFLTAIDRPQHRSIETDPRSSPRGREAQASPRSRPPGPLDLLAGSSRLGPRLAAKLVAASARASAKRNG